MSIRAVSSVLAFLLLCPSGGCLVDAEGDPVGSFSVVGELRENTCGEDAFAAVDPLEFDVEIRLDDGNTAFWRRPNAAIVSGSESDGAYRFRTRSSVQVSASDTTTGTAGCTLVQTEIVEFDLETGDSQDAVDGGVVPTRRARFTGTNEIQVSASSGSSCDGLLEGLGGSFQELPCSVTYDIVGEERSSIF